MKIRLLLIAFFAATLMAGSAQAAPPTTAPLQHTTVNGTNLGYRVLNPDAGGRPLVMVCGYGITMAEWPPSFVEELARNRRVVIFDNRGMGNSSGPVGPLSVGRMAVDTIRLIGRLGFRRTDILGWSMGGYIAQRVAIRRPDLIGRVILAATDPGSPRALQARPWVTKRLVQSTSPADLLPILFPRSKLAAGRAWFQAVASQPNLTPTDFSTPPETMRQQTLTNAGRWFGPRHGTFRALGRLTSPTLIAHGTKDLVVPPGNSRILARRIPRSAVLRFPDAGHAFLAQTPIAAARRFNRFLNRG